ncbi:replication-associated recombination protein A [Akkermansiaceae bacterium]|nr:replication-associated recombination protein A [Akkermansiaceae bacterium]
MDELFTNEEGLSEKSSSGKNLRTSPKSNSRVPLAARMRPVNLDEIVGQRHILSEEKILRRAIQTDSFSSFLFYGPPGTGKTTLASVIAKTTQSRFESLNGVESNVSEIRDKIAQARTHKQLRNQDTILFIDEIHRFNKAQQDVLLPHIELNTVRFIGATTHNPYYYVNSPLVSRSQIFQLEPIATQDIVTLLWRAAKDEEKGLGKMPLILTEEALHHIAIKSDGDARKALNALELAALSTSKDQDGTIQITLEVAEESIQQKAVQYDANGDSHYDTISAFIKSIRGSDPDAALYWLAKMLTAGEDPKYIARRLVISASEDIGLADSNALNLAISAQQAYETLGMPEGRIPLAHATVYLATAPKSNSAYAGLNQAMADIQSGATLPVPLHLRTKTRKKIASMNGATDQQLEYFYSHDYEGNYVPQRYFNGGKQYYTPTENGMEKRISERLEFWKNSQKP